VTDHLYDAQAYQAWHKQTCTRETCPDRYAVERAKAVTIAQGLRAYLAKVRPPLPEFWFRDLTPEEQSFAEEAERRGLDPWIGVIASRPNPLLDVPMKPVARIAHIDQSVLDASWPTRDQLPLTDPDE
jgi:hypothetical protein